MKLLELDIQNFRGIKNLKITPQGKNFLISGPNGSGKSAVVDAVDFLLTGQVSRMTGAGTKGITIKKHAKHIDADEKDVQVSALVELHGVKEPFYISRSLHQPKKIVFDHKYREFLEPVLELATRGQHVLTRREILNYVTADARTRGKQITELLKLQDIDKTRKALIKVKNELMQNYDSALTSRDDYKAKIMSTTGANQFSEKETLEYLNQQRHRLGGEPLDHLQSSILSNINRPSGSSSGGLNFTLLQRNIQQVRDYISQRTEWEKWGSEYETLTGKLVDGPGEQLKLARMGLKLSRDQCPLCDTPWDETDLRQHLEGKISQLEVVAEYLDRIVEIEKDVSQLLKITRASLEELVNQLEPLGLTEESEVLIEWEKELTQLDKQLDEEKYPPFIVLPTIGEILDRIEDTAQNYDQGTSPEEEAWDVLNKLEDKIQGYLEASDETIKTNEDYLQSEILLNSFIKSHDQVLNNLYQQIKERFVELYQELHGTDEIDFDALITPKGGGVDLQGDFHGRGVNPPHALHSEGHQDSMGICLYLALAEQLTEGYIDLIVLDDVMMSVDAPHRQEICRLLAGFFKGRQFFITTHDQTWARQLRLEGVVSSKGVVELYDWTIDTGPRVNSQSDMWEAIEKDLRRNDVPSAAHKLRRGSEEYFRTVCDALGAKVKFRDNNQFTLGDLSPPAINRYKKLINTAKDAANSWNKQEEVSKLVSIEKGSKEIFNRSNAENWAINLNVHYNKWPDFTLNDFKPVVGAFEDLYSVFVCDNCGGMLHLSLDGNTEEAVRCKCGSVNWNLNKK